MMVPRSFHLLPFPSFGGVLLSFLFLAGSCGSQPERLVKEPEPVKLVGGFGFAEGPAVDNEGRLYFTDIPGNRIYRWTPEVGLELIRDSTGWGNGMCFNGKGDLIVCEMTNRRLTKIDTSGELLEVLTASYMGNRYHSPNDVWVHPAGGIYFTDPAYFAEKSEMEMEVEAVYYIDPLSGKATRVTGHLVRPNGLAGTSDGRTLYVVSDTVHRTWRFRIMPDGSLEEKELFVANGHDGITLDERGNLYVANRDSLSVDIYDSRGKFRERIRFPEQPSNVCFGGSDGRLLIVTAQSSVYAVEMNISGQ